MLRERLFGAYILTHSFLLLIESQQCPVKYLLTFSSNTKTSQSFVEQQSFMQASEDATSSSLIKRAPIALDSSVRMIVEE